MVWKQAASRIKGGRKGGINPENPTHYADIDQPLPDGRTLRDICAADPSKVTVADWQQYYDALGHTRPGERGLLPFRVWQFFDTMVEAVKNKDIAAYVCAAGIAAHYVGDACQSLHGSYLNNGYPDGRGEDVHSAYETAMIDHQAAVLLPLIAQEVAAATDRPALLENGQEVAVAIFDLMVRTATALPPVDLVDAYIETGGGKSRRVTSALWRQFGQATAAAMADGARTLAFIWDSAWAAGGGNRLGEERLGAVDTVALRKLYEDKTFMPSLTLDQIGDVLRR
ncbi:hypothetical protein KHC23_20215 [Ancylobacter dichloromethanicus]|uniref:hypothetical protein n=1 Tax=Ancylobacter dichloromethanicus TaxID=518825 RepID=UPI001BCC1291|nr:hypothetical protein [Ancylobacter dichloromethanicus]MBS7555963.1 hypothetical protein [Ancylobacter dichloromethanicus]